MPHFKNPEGEKKTKKQKNRRYACKLNKIMILGCSIFVLEAARAKPSWGRGGMSIML